MGYKFKIEKNQKKYIFVLYPNNSNIQPIGESCDYDSISECSKALSQFRKIIKQTNTEYSICIDEFPENKFLPYLVYRGEKIFSRTLKYTVSKKECDKWLNRIIRNIDAELK